MSKLFRYGGIAASIVLIAFGIGAVVVGVNGRDQVRSDLAREQIVGTPDSTIPGQKVDTGSEAKAFANVMRKHTLEATGGQTYAQMGRSSTSHGKPTNDEKAAAIDPEDAEAGRERPAQHLGHRDRADDRAEHGLLRRERRHVRDRHGLRPAARRRRLPRAHAGGAAPQGPRARGCVGGLASSDHDRLTSIAGRPSTGPAPALSPGGARRRRLPRRSAGP